MATLTSTQTQVLVGSVEDRDRDEPRSKQYVREEWTPLLRTTQRRMGLKVINCCVKSKAALLVLCWNVLVTTSAGYILEYGSVLANFPPYAKELQVYAPMFFGFLALLYLFYPLAGRLADIRCGRYRIISNSLRFIILGGVFMFTGAAIIVCNNHNVLPLQMVSLFIILAVSFGLSTFFDVILFSSYISFSANVIQFGMDQLHDSPAEDSVLFINWFVLTSYLGAAINKFAITSSILIYTCKYK